MGIPGYKSYKSRMVNFFYGLIQKRQLGLWGKMFQIPRSQLRLTMCLAQNGNGMARGDLVDKLVAIGYSKNREAAKAAYHRGLDKGVLVEKEGLLSVVEPVSLVIRFGSVFDGWKIFVVPSAILAVVSSFIMPSLVSVFTVLTFGLIVFGYVVDWVHTVKY